MDVFEKLCLLPAFLVKEQLLLLSLEVLKKERNCYILRSRYIRWSARINSEKKPTLHYFLWMKQILNSIHRNITERVWALEI